jgi:Icc-related predicted phosphoesterase
VKAAAVSDLHGLKARFTLLGRLLDEGIDTLFIVGDIAASGYPEDQRADVRTNFGALLKGRRGLRVFAIPGNDDWAIVESTLREFPEIAVPSSQAIPLDTRFSVLGYPYVPITPFTMKDYEKWDSSDDPTPLAVGGDLDEFMIKRGINIFGLKSEGTKLHDFAFDPADRTDNIFFDLERVAGLSNPRDTLYLIHVPPAGFFDRAVSAAGLHHIGSRAVAEFIRKNEPMLTIHGHGHEAVDMAGGEFRVSIGQSTVLAVGPGNDPGILNFLLLELTTGSYDRKRLRA